MKTLIKNAKVILENSIQNGAVIIEDNKILDILSQASIMPPADKIIDAKGMYLSPGFIDIHTHGAAGEDFMQENVAGFYKACCAHMAHGTTTIVPTTLSGSKEQLLSLVKFFNTINLKRDKTPEIAGIHLEGPYFSSEQCGAQNPAFLRNPEPNEYNEVLSVTSRISRWSFAVELDGAPKLLQALQSKGIIASLAHSAATCAQVVEAHKCGLTALTHFYSGMAGVKRVNAYRVAGAIEAGYLIDDLFCEVIADGSHLPAELLQLIYKIKGCDKICLVTDSMSAACMPQGEYSLGGVPCIVEDGVAKLADRSAFAGSVATTDRLVKTFKQLTDAPLHECVKMMSLTPARLMRIDAKKGSICQGKDADLLIFDENINIQQIILRGTLLLC